MCGNFRLVALYRALMRPDEVLRRARFGGFGFPDGELLADRPALVFELLAANLRQYLSGGSRPPPHRTTQPRIQTAHPPTGGRNAVPCHR
jgi:hypothetical protein